MANEHAAQEEANRLYWESDSSVGDIAERLGVSRRTLYELVEPTDAGESCPRCGTDMVYANRLARTTGDAHCPACGFQRGGEGALTGAESPGALSAPAQQEMIAAHEAALGGGMAGARAAGLGGALLAGVAVGALLVLLGRRR